MKQTVLAFSGGIGSGKSSVTAAVSERLGCPRASFGGVIRERARREGLGQERSELQSLGERWIEADVASLCAAVLQAASPWRPGSALVIDGARHVRVAELLRELVRPSPFRLVYLKAGAAVREERVRERGEAVPAIEVLDRHSTEAEVHTGLAELADAIFDVTAPFEVVVAQVVAWAEALD